MAETIDYPHNNKYRKDYLEALEPWKKGRHEESVEAAKYNLTDPTLPRYFQIKNRVLIVLAEHDWAIAERFRRETERIYAAAVSLTKPKEVAELRVLATLRTELDELKEVRGEDPQLYGVLSGDMAKVEIEEKSILEGKAKSEIDGVLAEDHTTEQA